MSLLIYHTPEQKKLAEEGLKIEQAKRNKPVYTKILDANEYPIFFGEE